MDKLTASMDIMTEEHKEHRSQIQEWRKQDAQAKATASEDEKMQDSQDLFDEEKEYDEAKELRKWKQILPSISDEPSAAQQLNKQQAEMEKAIQTLQESLLTVMAKKKRLSGSASQWQPSVNLQQSAPAAPPAPSAFTHQTLSPIPENRPTAHFANNSGNNGESDTGSISFAASQPPSQPPYSGLPVGQSVASTSSFKFELKPDTPPKFTGKEDQDVDTWIFTVRDFLELFPMQEPQFVSWVATLFREEARDWWANQNVMTRPRTFTALCTALRERFGSNLREERARRDLANLRLKGTETVRQYASQFESLLGKLPSVDQGWAKHQFVQGLPQRIAELVTISEAKTLPSIIKKAEEIEMAHRVVSGFTQPRASGAKTGTRGTGFWRGRGRSSGRQSTPSTSPSSRGQSRGGFARGRGAGARGRCHSCGGTGHWARECPSAQNFRGGNRGGGRFRGRGRGTRGRTALHLVRGADVDYEEEYEEEDVAAPGDTPPQEN